LPYEADELESRDWKEMAYYVLFLAKRIAKALQVGFGAMATPPGNDSPRRRPGHQNGERHRRKILSGTMAGISPLNDPNLL